MGRIPPLSPLTLTLNEEEKPFWPYKMVFFKWAWWKVKVVSRLALGLFWFQFNLIRPLKWGTVCLWTPTGSKNTCRQNWKFEKTSVLLLIRTNVQRRILACSDCPNHMLKGTYRFVLMRRVRFHHKKHRHLLPWKRILFRGSRGHVTSTTPEKNSFPG